MEDIRKRPLETSWLERIPYAQGLDLQAARVEEVKAGSAPEALFLLEHNPVLTLGRNAGNENIVATPEELSSLGIEVHECGRGGDVTYHGPGQLVGYPILSLAPDQKDIGKYVRGLEEALIQTLSDFGLTAGRKQGMTGVWMGDDKIAAIGVRISRWVTSHGFALNVTTNLDHFKTIVPCGIQDYGVTSLERLLPTPPSLVEVGECFAPHFGKHFNREIVWTSKEVSCHA